MWHFSCFNLHMLIMCGTFCCVISCSVYKGFKFILDLFDIVEILRSHSHSLSGIYRSSKRSDVNCVNIIKSKDLLAWNEDNMSEWSDVSTCGLLFQWPSTIKNSTKHFGLVQGGHHYHLIECKLFLPWYSWKNVIWS